MSQIVTVETIEGEYQVVTEESSALAIDGQSRLSALFEEFLAAQDISDNSRATYRRQLRQFTNWLQESGYGYRIGELGKRELLDYKSYLLERLSPRTVSSYIVAVRRLYAWLEDEGLTRDIARNIKGAKAPRNKAKDTLSPGQLTAVLAAIKEADELSAIDRLRDYAMFNLMASTGLRDIEVSRARVGDIRYEQGQAVLWVHGKGRDSRDEYVTLEPAVLEPLQAYIKGRGHLLDEAPLFPSSSPRNYGESLSPRSISRIIKNSLRRVGIDSRKLSAHSLRHTAITLAIQGGAKPQDAQAMARHRNINTTMGYYRNIARLENRAEQFISFERP